MITTRTKLFAILWLAGMLGVLSILLIDLSAVLANLPAAAGSEMPFHPLLIKLLSIVQPTILLTYVNAAAITMVLLTSSASTRPQ